MSREIAVTRIKPIYGVSRQHYNTPSDLARIPQKDADAKDEIWPFSESTLGGWACCSALRRARQQLLGTEQ
jgi:hypothetical protein